MKHPTAAELTDLERGELPIERAREIRDHLEKCEACRREWEAMQNVARELVAWEDEPVSTAFVTATMNAIARTDSAPAPDGRRAAFGWVRRVSIAAAAVAVSLLFQAFVWNPLDTPRSFRAIFDLTPEAAALSAGAALPDTILVLTVHPDGKMSTELLGEEIGELEDLIPRIIERADERDVRAVLLLGSDPEGTITIDRSDLTPLLEELDIEQVTAGAGVVLITGRSDVVARIGVPIEYVIGTVPRIEGQIVRIDIADSLVSRATAAQAVRTALVLSRSGSVRSAGEFAVETRYARGEERPIVQVIRPRLEFRSRSEPAAVLHDSLMTPQRLLITVNDAGEIVTSWSTLPLEDFRDMADRIIASLGDIPILLLIPEGSENSESILLQILEEAGGTKTTVRRIKK